LLIVLLAAVPAGPAPAQHGTSSHESGHEAMGGHGHGPAAGVPQWEGSAEGIAYSERNHHLAGVFVLLIALTELREALAPGWLAWSRFLLPAAMLGAGGFLLIWSDHEAWPIGPLSFPQTFFGNDHEILQHKTYGILLLAVGMIESLRRTGWLAHAAWTAPLPVFAIIGGLMLFMHSHGDHPSADKIALHHTAMGTMAIFAGTGRLVSMRTAPAHLAGPSRWSLAWAGCILLIGVQLLLYAE
jgi:putative copper resistance protein D